MSWIGVDCNPWFLKRPINQIWCKIVVFPWTRLRDDALHYFIFVMHVFWLSFKTRKVKDYSQLNSSKWQILLKCFHSLVVLPSGFMKFLIVLQYFENMQGKISESNAILKWVWPYCGFVFLCVRFHLGKYVLNKSTYLLWSSE